jgi:transcriptional regulator with XRE-family HTH domain
MTRTLRDLRIEKGLFQKAVAEALGTTTAAISSWETGRTEPEPPTIPRLAEFFGVSVQEIREAIAAAQQNPRFRGAEPPAAAAAAKE